MCDFLLEGFNCIYKWSITAFLRNNIIIAYDIGNLVM